jgi:ribosome-associated toxin RatA of RatAB toxin-antitoxin module
MNTPLPTPGPRKRRWSRWLLIPAVLMALFGVVVLAAYIRGEWAETTPRDPAAVGPVSQVYQSPDGQKQVRCAVRLPYPREKVWAVVTDYAHYGESLPYLRDVQVEPLPDGARLTGEAQAAFQGDWHFQTDLHEEKTGDAWSVRWDQPGGDLLVNRGGWEARAVGPDETLLVLTLEAQVAACPTFILRDFFLYRLPQVLQSVDRRVQAR